MSEEQLKAFLEKVKGDAGFQEKIKAAADSEAVLAIAKEAGFMISADELNNAESELSEEDIESISGGGRGYDSVNHCNHYPNTNARYVC